MTAPERMWAPISEPFLEHADRACRGELLQADRRREARRAAADDDDVVLHRFAAHRGKL